MRSIPINRRSFVAAVATAVAAEPFVKAMAIVGEDIAYPGPAEFKAFWEADAKRLEEAVRLIGKI